MAEGAKEKWQAAKLALASWRRGVYQALAAACRKIPLVGRLGEIPRADLKQAFYETLTTTLFATMPFWILPVFGFFIYTPKPALSEALQKGEGLVYASVLLGPLVYVLTRRYGRFNLLNREGKGLRSPLSMSFPYGGLFVTITALSCAVAGFAFAAMQRAGLKNSEIDQTGVMSLSWIMMGLATTIFFLVTAYRNLLDGLEKDKGDTIVEEQPRQEDDFVSNWLGAKS